MRVNFTLEFHPNLAVMDDLAVSHFEPGGGAFHVETPHDRLRVGAILMGSLVGNWAAHEHSARALHIGKNNEHKRGGVAYIRRVTALTELADGSTRVETSRDIGGVQLFPSGGFGVDFNATEVRPTGRLRTDAEALQAFRENSMGASDDDATAFFFGGGSEVNGGDEDENDRRLNTGICDSQCSDDYVWSTTFEYDRLVDDDTNEFCFYCFEYERT